MMRELGMRLLSKLLSLKLLPWALLVSIVSVLAIASNTHFLDNYLPATLFSDTTISAKSPDDNKPHRNSITDSNKNISIADNTFSNRVPNTGSFGDKFFSDGFSGTAFSKSNFNELPEFRQLNHGLSGIDGTGGSLPPKHNGIDGTGGSSETIPPKDDGIDGTGGPDEPRVADCVGPECDVVPPGCPNSPECVERPPECTDPVGCDGPLIISNVTAEGTLEIQYGYFVVNGIKFKVTNNTRYIINGKLTDKGSAPTLSTGHVVLIHGSVNELNETIANEVIYTTPISGEITFKGENSITVLGQTIVVPHGVLFGGTATSFDDLLKGDTVKVSGYKFFNQDLSATLIERLNLPVETISGKISSIGKDSIIVLGRTVVLNAKTTFTGTANKFSDLQVGDTVNVSGGKLANNNLSAGSIKRVNSSAPLPPEPKKTPAHISGLITKMTYNSITVQGRKILVDSEVTFTGTATQFIDLLLKDNVEISGFEETNGDLSATDIHRINTPINKLIGVISQLDQSNSTFDLNGLTVNYSELASTVVLANDMVVQVQGAMDREGQSIFNASAIKVLESILDSGAEKVTLEGFITEFTDTFNFKVAGVPVSLDRQTELIGNDRDDLKLNVKIKVEGEIKQDLDGNKFLFAKKNSFLAAVLTSHKNNMVLTSSKQTFHWKDVNAKAYYVRIYGNTDRPMYEELFDGKTTSATISGLPENGSTFSLFLFSKHGQIWEQRTYTFTGANTVPTAELTSHEYGEFLKSTTETFTWNHVDEAESYRLYIFDYHSQKVYYDGRFTEPEAVVLSDLPTNGADVDVVLYTLHKGWWAYNYYALKSVQLLKNARLTSHYNGESISSDTETFTWEDVGAEKYQLRLAKRRANGWFDDIYLEEFDGSITSATISGLPLNSAELQVRLRTSHGDWATEYHTVFGAGVIPSAELIGHVNRGSIKSTTETFEWKPVPEAEAYHLIIGNIDGFGGPNYLDEDYDAFITSVEISGLPKNQAEMGVVLQTKVNGYWSRKTFVLYGTGEQPESKLTSHSGGELITSPVTITWSDVDADAYHVVIKDLSSHPRVRLHDQAYDADTHSAVLENLPENTPLLISIHSKHGEWWSRDETGVVTGTP